MEGERSAAQNHSSSSARKNKRIVISMPVAGQRNIPSPPVVPLNGAAWVSGYERRTMLEKGQSKQARGGGKWMEERAIRRVKRASCCCRKAALSGRLPPPARRKRLRLRPSPRRRRRPAPGSARRWAEEEGRPRPPPPPTPQCRCCRTMKRPQQQEGPPALAPPAEPRGPCGGP